MINLQYIADIIFQEVPVWFPRCSSDVCATITTGSFIYLKDEAFKVFSISSQVKEEEQSANHTVMIQETLQQASVELSEQHHLVVSSDEVEGIETVTVYTQGGEASEFIVYVQEAMQPLEEQAVEHSVQEIQANNYRRATQYCQSQITVFCGLQIRLKLDANRTLNCSQLRCEVRPSCLTADLAIGLDILNAEPCTASC